MIALVVLAIAAQQHPQLSEAVMREIINYSECASVRAIALARSPRSREAIADAALAACGEHEQALQRQMTTEYGARGAELVRDVRSGMRRAAIETVAIERGSALPPNPFRVWGACLGNGAVQAGRGTMPPEAAADAAIADCREQEASALRDAVGRLGQSNGETAIRNFRDQFRGMVIRSRSGRLGDPN